MPGGRGRFLSVRDSLVAREATIAARLGTTSMIPGVGRLGASRPPGNAATQPPFVRGPRLSPPAPAVPPAEGPPSRLRTPSCVERGGSKGELSSQDWLSGHTPSPLQFSTRGRVSESTVPSRRALLFHLSGAGFPMQPPSCVLRVTELIRIFFPLTRSG
ncbi:hypothetical protein NDU88_001293 [Pleurodeles waltl]|uniref:Uncharacterized protein n=1 Tax=Pleurodeles waltl TaxID=8319 RepID=A0AAV7LB06_PLEWA|nr:hypothetical protein NDU88_001293 [Pleurodeles waltl]